MRACVGSGVLASLYAASPLHGTEEMREVAAAQHVLAKAYSGLYCQLYVCAGDHCPRVINPW